MNPIMNSHSESPRPTTPYEWLVEQVVARGAATPPVKCKIFSFGDCTQSSSSVPAKHTTIDTLIARWNKSEVHQKQLQDARRWVADTFHADEGDTVRTLRLRKGWSQTRLAEEIITSQSHIARIERGTENIAIETCRRLAVALEVDMNTLNDALHRQEVITQSRVAR